MHLFSFLPLLLATPALTTTLPHRIPTVRESAAMARRMLRLEKLGTLSTVFPTNDTPHKEASRPDSVAGTPLGLMEYFGDCEPSTGNPTLLAITIASSFRNVEAGSNITLSMRWHPPHPADKRLSPASLPRFALVGTIEDMDAAEVRAQGIRSCFATYHPDSVVWMPGNHIHESRWVRLVVKEVYWFGGFGDRAYIGWIPLDVWQNITEKEIKETKLPGEKTGGFFSWLPSVEL
ncbi:hypothetical protein EJ06DRAFT_526493 [Trichodelitschia bisporula]|uniref:CREG-like beta-barrel domain-containing protein n=1 Tax=Trichodelitschia bisporula TaxID=703511 RepID=A0A6G1I7Z4_9PEZI|nr:hypothetical protein EJ06DRAFT_526493 [Trichodelitschia bisporula]